jgi:glycosyltransferase involved in cell wall biosynthesis
VELAVRLVQIAGVRVTLLTYQAPNFFERRLKDAGVPVVQLPKRGKLDPAFPVRLRRWIHINDVDVVHAFLLGPVLWSYLAFRSIPSSSRPVFIAAERNAIAASSPLEARIKKFIFQRSKRVTVNSQAAADEIHRELGVPRNQIVYIPNSINVAEWDQAATYESPIPLQPECLHFALIGRIAPQKNHQLVLEALSHLPRERIKSWRVWFVGDDKTHLRLAARLRDEIAKRDLGRIVRVLPPVRDVAAFISRLDGLLLPSLWEGFPNVVLEAMTLRVPVIARPVGEVANILEHGKSGLLLKHGSAAELADAMRHLEEMADSSRAQMGAHARTTVESRYEIAAVSRRYLELYRSVVSQKGPDGV